MAINGSASQFSLILYLTFLQNFLFSYQVNFMNLLWSSLDTKFISWSSTLNRIYMWFVYFRTFFTSSHLILTFSFFFLSILKMSSKVQNLHKKLLAWVFAMLQCFETFLFMSHKGEVFVLVCISCPWSQWFTRQSLYMSPFLFWDLKVGNKLHGLFKSSACLCLQLW